MEVYSVPKGVEVPNFSNYNWAEETDKEEKFYADLRAVIKPLSKSEYNGKLVRFPMADSHAEYMVVSIKPLELIHIPLGDAWHFQYINRMIGKDITDRIDDAERLAEFFSK